MAQLKKYTSFEALKLNEKPGNVETHKDTIFSEFDPLIKRLQSEYSNKKNINGKCKAA